MYMRDPVQVIKQHISALEHFNSMEFRPVTKPVRSDGTTYQSSPLETSHFHDVYKSVRHRVFSSSDSTVIWNENNPSRARSFVGFLQLFSDKTATTLTTSAFVAYPLHEVLLNTTAEKREWLINNGYTIIGFLPVSISDFDIAQKDMENTVSELVDAECHIKPLDDDVRLTSTSEGREQNMLVLHSALRKAFQALEDVCTTGFIVRSTTCGTWRCFPAVVSYCSDIPEAKNLTTVRHGLTVTRPCHRCLATLSDFEKFSDCLPRHRSQTTDVRRIVAECKGQLQSLVNTRPVNLVRLQKQKIEDTLKTY